MGDAIGSKNTCKTFSTEFCDWRIPSKKSSFSTVSASRHSQSKTVGSRKPFFDCITKHDSGFSRKRPFSTDKSDSIRNGLTLGLFTAGAGYSTEYPVSWKRRSSLTRVKPSS